MSFFEDCLSIFKVWRLVFYREYFKRVKVEVVMFITISFGSYILLLFFMVLVIRSIFDLYNSMNVRKYGLLGIILEFGFFLGCNFRLFFIWVVIWVVLFVGGFI